MQTKLLKIAGAGLLAAVMVVNPLVSRADGTTNKAPAAADETAKKGKSNDTPFTGVLTAVDTNAMTLTFSNLVLHVTSSTVIKKGSQSATLAEAAVGQPTRGTYRKGPDGDGKFEAVTLHLNSKEGNKGKSGSKKKKSTSETPAASGTSTNSAAN